MSGLFFADHGTPIAAPEDIIPFLGPETHWREGRSVYEVVHSWLGAKGIPQPVLTALAGDAAFEGAWPLKVYFERRTKLDGLGPDSQTDVIALVGTNTQIAILGIEAKVDETFGPLVIDCTDTPGGDMRLEGLLRVLGMPKERAWDLRYRLLQRTVAVAMEAANFKVKDAALLVQSFSPVRAGFGDFQDFTRAMNVPLTEPGRLTPPASINGVAVRFGWVQDVPRKRLSMNV